DAHAPDARAAIASAIDLSIIDQHHVLTTSTRRALTETIARELAARSALSGEEYVKAIENTPGVRWLDPGVGSEWLGVDEWFAAEFGVAPDRNDPRAVLVAGADAQLVKEKNRISRYGIGDRGILVAASRIRSEDQIHDALAAIAAQDSDYWFSAPATGAYRLRVPIRSLEQVLREENQAIIAASLCT